MTAARHGDAGDGFDERHFTAQDGLRLYFRDYGWGREQGERFAVLCLPGLARNSKDYQDLAQSLARRCRVLCPDYRGVGRSQYAPHWRAYSPQANLNDLRHLLAVTGIDRVVAIGTSYGGILAAGLAIMLPAAVRGVVLNDIGPDVAPGSLRRVLAHVGGDPRPASWVAAVDYMKRTFPHLPARDEKRWLRIAQHTFCEIGGLLRVDWDIALAKPLPGLWGEIGDLWPLFRALSRIPTLAVRGQLSDILSPHTFTRMAAEIGGLDTLTVPGVGHAPDLAEPPARGRIETFLDGI
jgi:pimeloyl-ACP methyl ester carboxylesterase